MTNISKHSIIKIISEVGDDFMESKFVLSELITNNILKENQDNFIRQNNLLSEYTRSGKKFNYFVQDCINEGKIDRTSLDDFLFEGLFYGYQRETYIYKVDSYDKTNTEANNFLNCIKRLYGYVNSNMFNIIAHTIGDLEEKELVAMKVVYNRTVTQISKVQIIFGKNVSIIKNGTSETTISYIPIEWDVVGRTVIVKVAPKRRLLDKTLKPENLNRIYARRMQELFGIEFMLFDNLHKEAICRMSKDLYEQIYNKMVVSKPQGIDVFVAKMAEELKEKLQIEALELKSTINNIFNIKDSLQKQVENILISDILLDVEQGGNLEGIEGVVTYLKFSDGKKISARLKGKQCRDPIFDSESYMALRSAIENAHRTSRLGVVWLEKFDRLRVTYDATDIECLNIHFYRNLSKEEFEYGLQMYWKYEQGNDAEGNELSKLEVRA